MPLKTYALLDLIGVTTAIGAGSAAKLLETFWSTADTWTTSSSHKHVFIPSGGYRTTPTVFVSTFSDSALLHTAEELLIDDFYDIVRSFKSTIERRVCPAYVIVSRNAEIPQPTMPALGAIGLSPDHLPLYTKVAGSGDAWVNLHLADAAIKKQRQWHGRYSMYCVGDDSLPKTPVPGDHVDCKGLSNTVCVYALE